MRRSHLCLAATILATGIAIAVSVHAPVEQAHGQDPPAVNPAKEPAADRFAIPQSDEVSALVSFVKTLRSIRPELGPALDEYDEKAPAAIRKACERILELDKNEDSPARKLARHEMLIFRVNDLASSHDVTAEQRKTLAADCAQILKDSERLPADAELATTLATTFEEFAPADEAKELYESLGELFVRNTNDAIALRGQYLLGAARRLDVVGKPFELSGQTADGADFEIASMKGKYVLVVFWATWSGHCLDDIPNLKRNYQAYRNRSFEIVGVNVDEDRDTLDSFLKKNALPWLTLHDDQAGSEHPAAIHYGVASYPTSFLLDPNGRVMATDLRGKSLNRKLAQLCGSGIEQRSSYPAFNVGEVIDKLTSAGAKLHKAGKTKGDADLRKNLGRRSVELELPEPSDEPISDKELYRRASESVFIVCSLYKVEGGQWQTSLATAFAVARDGVLTTSCHVFDNEDEADAVVVMDVQQKVYAVRELLAVNKRADTCLFRIDATDLRPLPFADEASPGTRVRVLGHPGDSFYFLSSGLLANYEKDHEGTVWMNTTADFGQGSSGGPALDECGNVVGQVSRTYTLYAGGAATRGRPRRVAADKKPADKTAADKRELDPAERAERDVDIADPQMVFKSCVPVKTLRSLVKVKKVAGNRE